MTRSHQITTSPVDLVAALSLPVGGRYMLEVVNGNSPVRLYEGGAAAPTDLGYFHTIMTGRGRLGIQVAADKPIWVWSIMRSRLAVTDTP